MKVFENDLRSIELGTIQIWGGNISDIPAGWVICDGNNGTPDLTDKFVKSVSGAGTDPGNVVGQNSKSISKSQMPPHSHTGSTSNTTIDHNHQYSVKNNQDHDDGGTDQDWTQDQETSSTSHSHPLSIGSAGSGNSMSNIPQNYEIAFITKL